MIQFKMVRYHRKEYPSYIPLEMEEAAGHFDAAVPRPALPYSLHTEYSYGARTFKNSLLKKYPEIAAANKGGVPQLWKSEAWAEMFAQFLIDLTRHTRAPDVIEIHPPFQDYMGSIKDFVNIYKVFETAIRSRYEKVRIHLENRCGSLYQGGAFLISTAGQLKELCSCIESARLSLRIALDIPQLYTAHRVTPGKSHEICRLLDEAAEMRPYLDGVHIWGKTLANGRRIAHCGDLNTYFNHDMALKGAFLAALGRLFNDSRTRNLVLEVNSSSDDLVSIIEDLRQAGFTYV